MTDFFSNILRFAGIFFFLILVPTSVFANAGSAMMWFGLFHLVILNAIIGAAESAILFVKKIDNRTWLIVLANYISMFIGLSIIAPYFSSVAGNPDFWGNQTSAGSYKIGGFIFGMVMAFVTTLVVEFPFYCMAVKQQLSWKEIFNASLTANCWTNLVMFLVYFYYGMAN